VSLNVLPDRRFREGVKAQLLSFAVRSDRLELFVPEDGDDAVQENPVQAWVLRGIKDYGILSIIYPI
jgi:hypothetical protein